MPDLLQERYGGYTVPLHILHTAWRGLLAHGVPPVQKRETDQPATDQQKDARAKEDIRTRDGASVGEPPAVGALDAI
jgi:hypothetical protein